MLNTRKKRSKISKVKLELKKKNGTTKENCKENDKPRDGKVLVSIDVSGKR